MNRLSKCLLFFAVAAMLLTASVQAQNTAVHWIDPGMTGDFNTPASWSTGTIPQTGEWLWVGNATLPTGVANITADLANSPAYIYVARGAGTNGTVNQTGGIVTLTGGVRGIGRDGGTGVYNISGGKLTMQGAAGTNVPLLIGSGANSVGAMNLTNNAEVNAAGFLPDNNAVFIGENGGTGSLSLKDTSIFNSTGNFYVGREGATSVGTVTLNQSAILNNNNGWMVIGGGYGVNHGGTGTLTVNDSATVNSISYTIIGFRGGTGMLNVNNGTMNVNGAFQVANGEFRSGASGTVNLTGTAHLNTGSFQTGFRSNAVAVVNMSGDSQVHNTGDTFIGHYGGPGGSSTLNMSGNSKFINDAGFQIANSENSDGPTIGTVNMTDSASIVEGAYVMVGAWSGGSTATLNMSGNSSIVQTGDPGQFYIGYGGSISTVTLNDNASITNTGTVMSINEPLRGAISTLNLNGGVFATNFILGGQLGCSQTINLNGGTLQAQGDSGNFMAGTSAYSAFVKGGANIITEDTGFLGHTVRISVPLKHDPTGPATDGGLTVSGSGNLILSAQNTYTGATAVNGGTLTLTRPATLATPSVSMASGATLALGSAANLGPLTGLNLASGSTLGVSLSPLTTDPNAINTAAMPNTSGISYKVNAAGTSLATGTYTIIEGFTGGTPSTGSVESTSMRKYNQQVNVLADKVQVVITDTGNSAASLLWNAAIPLTWDVKTSPCWTGADGLFNNLDAVTFNDDGLTAEAKTVTIAGIVHPSSINIITGDASSPWLFQGPGGITGEGTTLTKVGDGALTIDTGIDITGTIDIQGGTFATGANSGMNTLSGPIVISNGSKIGVGGPQLTLSGAVSDVANSGLRKVGAGTLALTNNANPLHGPTVLDAGTLQISKIGNGGEASPIGDTSADAANLVFNGGTIQYTGASNVTTDRGFHVLQNWSGIDSDKDITFTGLITSSVGEGGFIKTGSGSLTLANVNNATQFYEVQVREGVLNLAGDATHTPTYGIGLPSNYGSLLIGVAGTTAAVNLDKVTIQGGAGNLYVGVDPNSSGYIKIKDGVTFNNTDYWFTYIGVGSGKGVLDQTGGYFESAQYTEIGAGGMGFGVYNMTGGVANINNRVDPWSFNVGTSGASTGVLNVSGTAQMTVSNVMYIGVYDSATGIVNLGAVGSGGGTLTVPAIGQYYTSTTGYLNFHGGTLKASGDSASFLGYNAAMDGTYIYGEGAKIDSNGHNITINTPLSAPSGYGLTSIAVGGGGTGYIGSPVVEITGGSGTGATAVAVMNGDKVDHIVITNPGTGYASSDVLTVKLVGQVGAGGTAATVGTVAMGLNDTTGGLTKLGDGTLILSGVIGYNGPTTIAAGTLQISTPGAVTLSAISGAGALKVTEGTTLTIASINLDTLTIGGAAASAAAVPEPGTLVLLALAGLGVLLAAWRRK